MAKKFNNEVVGISAEIAIADIFGVPISDNYRTRGSQEVVDRIKLVVNNGFTEYLIPEPIQHIAEEQNPIDFLLKNRLTLSVKTNQKSLGKVAPQKIGQPSSKTYFQHFSHIIDQKIPSSYEDRRLLFKKISIDKIHQVIPEYWNNLFDCDYLIYFFNIINKIGAINSKPSYIVLGEFGENPKWEKKNFSFTQTVDSWNESCTVKYFKTSIGEFQAHQHRDCFKFRFNMDNILKLKKKNLI
ncbi:MAG: hypothetical protein R6U59_05115 [Eubacteriales bacterium]